MRRIERPVFAILVAAIVGGAGCAQVDTLQAPEFSSGTADFTTLVAVGSSLTMGVQNAGISESSQRSSYAAFFARQVGKTVYTNGSSMPRDGSDAILPQPGEFVIPGYGEPGSPGTLVLAGLVPPTIEPIPNPGAPVNTTYPIPYNNLAVSGANLEDILETVTDPGNSLFDFVLRGQGTMVQQAMSLDPTFILLWAGANDVLGAATQGDPSLLTDPALFEMRFRTLVQTLLGENAKPLNTPIVGPPTNPGLVAANIPDVSAIPFVTTVPPFVVDPVTREPVRNPLTGGLIPYLGPDGPLALPTATSSGDYVTLAASSLIAQGFGFPEGAELPGGITGKGPLPGAVVISIAETAQIQATVDADNAKVAQICAEYGVPVVDINALFAEVASHGFEIGGIEYTAEFVLGGLFSLDGVHPTKVGQAVVANAFIETVNHAYGASIPAVNYADVLGFQFGVEPVSRPETVDLMGSEAFESLLHNPMVGGRVSPR